MPLTLRSTWTRCRQLAAAALFAATGLAAQAGYVTLPQADLDAIFSQQPAFASGSIQIRFNAQQNFYSNALINVDVASDMDIVYGGNGSSQKTIGMYFVDDISFCGVSSPGIVGCGWTGASGLVVESTVADDGNFAGANLLAHELLHNLNLDHFFGDAQNLMAPTLMSGMGTLTAAQVTEMLLSPFVQTDQRTGQRFIEVQPYAVLAEPANNGVPEPGTLALASLGLALAWRTRRPRHH